MPKASELKKGNMVLIEDEIYMVRRIEVQTPSSRGAPTLYKVRFTHIQTKRKLDQSFKGEQYFPEADLDRRPVQFLYRDGDMVFFMDLEDYNQYTINSADIEEQVCWITDGMEGITAMINDGYILGIELPQTVELEIIDTAPALKGATATGRTKPAVVSTGVEVQVPEYLENGDRIKVSPETGRFVSRA